MMLRATHDNKDGLQSSIVWSYGHVTIPRHLRDIVVTEYGVADLRGQSDSEVVKRLIAVADSALPGELIRQAKAHGKLEADYVLPERYRHNLPEMLDEAAPLGREAGLLPDFPFGTDLTGTSCTSCARSSASSTPRSIPGELLTMAIAEPVGDQGGAAALPPNGWLAETHLQGERVRQAAAGEQPV